MIAVSIAIVCVTTLLLALLARGAHTDACKTRLRALQIEAEGEAAKKALALAEEAAAATGALKRRIEEVADDARKAGLGQMGRRR